MRRGRGRPGRRCGSWRASAHTCRAVSTLHPATRLLTVSTQEPLLCVSRSQGTSRLLSGLCYLSGSLVAERSPSAGSDGPADPPVSTSVNLGASVDLEASPLLLLCSGAVTVDSS